MPRTSFRLLVVLLSGGVAAAVLTTTPPVRAEQSSAARARVAAASIALGDEHTCVLTTAGSVRCWGNGSDGRLGYASTTDRGDNETPAFAGDVDLGGTAVAIAAGGAHTCALLTTGRLRCWGDGGQGQLGYGNTTSIGDDETPAAAGDVPVGGKVSAIAAGVDHTCAVLRSGHVRCWGSGADGRLGYNGTGDIGGAGTPAEAGDVPLGGKATAITTGYRHTCALLTTQRVRCWGYGYAGRLGYGNEANVGDDETPASVGDVNVGGPVVAISAGALHTCALLTKHRVRCWGRGLHGRLGYGNGHDIGNDETPATAGNVELDAAAVSISAGGEHTCAATKTRYLRCWGRSGYGQLGYGNQDSIGSGSTPADVGNVPVIEPMVAVETGTHHSCALTPGGNVRCWGNGDRGRLGYANTQDIGDNEVAHEAGRIELGATARTTAAPQLRLRVTPRRDRRAPYVFTARGRLGGAFVVDAETCAGKVVIAARRPNGKKVAGAKTTVSPSCRFRRKLTVPGRKVPPGPAKLRITVRFAGSADLTPAALTRTVRVRR